MFNAQFLLIVLSPYYNLHLLLSVYLFASSATAEDMEPLFEKFGDIGDIYFPLERGTGRSRGFAFVR